MKEIDEADHQLFIVSLIMLLAGVIMIMSSSPVVAMHDMHDPMYYVKKQLLWIVLGFIAAVCAFNIKQETLKSMIPLILVVTVILVFLTFFGKRVGGAKRWIGWGHFSFQPYEFVKLALVIYLARVFSSETATTGKKVIKSLTVTALICFGLLIQPDRGGVIIVGIIYLTMYLISGMPKRNLLLLVPFAIIAIVYLLSKDSYSWGKISAWIESWIHPGSGGLGKGYHIQQSLIAIGSGGPLGVGFAHSQQKFFYLPTPHTDYIFSIIGEELGLWGTISVLLLFVFFMWRGALVALTVEDKFSKFMAAGITFMIMTQAFVNIGVALTLLPSKGTTLPFFSAGGSSIVVTMIGVGILLAVSRKIYGGGR